MDFFDIKRSKKDLEERRKAEVKQRQKLAKLYSDKIENNAPNSLSIKSEEKVLEVLTSEIEEMEKILNDSWKKEEA